MIAPFYPISCTHVPHTLHPIGTISVPRDVSFLCRAVPAGPFLCPLVNKAEAGDYLTFIRFRGESAGLTSKEARVEPRSAHCGTWRWAFDPCRTFFDASVCPVLSSFFYPPLCRRPCVLLPSVRWNDTDSVAFLPVIEFLGTGIDWTSCCRINWRSFVTSEKERVTILAGLYAISYLFLPCRPFAFLRPVFYWEADIRWRDKYQRRWN